MPLTAEEIARKYGRGGGPVTAQPTAASAASIAAKYGAASSTSQDYGTFTNAEAARFGADAPMVPRTRDAADKLAEQNPSLWTRISDNLMKPVSEVAVAAEQTGHILGNLIAGDGRGALDELKATPKKMGGILTGTMKRSFTDVFKDNWTGLHVDDNEGKSVAANFWNDGVPNILGTIVNMAADPLNFVGGGLTQEGKVAEKVTALNKAKETITADSKLMAQAKALGMTTDMLELGATKAEQVEKGQRALLTFFANTRWEKTLVGGSSIYKAMDIAGTGIKSTRVAQNIGKIFSTKTSDEAFNVTQAHFRDLLEYRRGQVMTDAMDIQNHIAQLPHEDAARIVDMIETAGGKPIEAIDDATSIARRLQDNLSTINETEKGIGLRTTELQDYFPHILENAKDSRSSWQKFKDLFKDANGFTAGDEAVSYGNAKEWSTSLDAAKQRKYEGTIAQIRENFGIDFKDNAAVAYAQRALGSAKAVTAKEFFGSVKQFGVSADDVVALEGKSAWVPTKAKELEGMKFSPDVARQIDRYYDAVKPAELNSFLKKFDSVQNWWKAQALVAPSYHIRNMAGNLWNNFLAGVNDPTVYYEAGRLQSGKAVQFVDAAGRTWDNSTLLEAAKMKGVINEGWYAKDIDVALSSEMGGLSYNPLKQNFALFRANRAVGTTLENNSRLALFLHEIKGGATLDDAALTVKKFLFDYGDLTWTEQNVLKRAVPFYTWTRKNVPLQVKSLMTQQGRVATLGATKVIKSVENNVIKPNEKYLGDYIKSNLGVRVGTDPRGNTMYFLLGQWLPMAQAVDFLSQPSENFVQSVSPFFKTPIELWANKSTFFEDTFGQPSQIERYPGENQSWLGLTMRKKTAYVLKNIRILNELDKLNPGGIFGDQDSPSLWNRISPDAGFKAPFGIGHVTTSQKRGGRYSPDANGTADKVFQSLFGKTTLYDPNMARQFYMWDTDTKTRELQKAIKDAQRDGQTEYAKRLLQELIDVKKSRQ